MASEKLSDLRAERRASVKRDAEGKAQRGVSVVIREDRRGNEWEMEEREDGEGRRVRARFRCVMVGKGIGEVREQMGLERRDRDLSCGRRLNWVREAREEIEFEESDRLVRLGVGGRAVMVVRLLEAAERVVREGNFLVISTIFGER